ncbi:uncharacterized protein LOC106179867 [Lingula anatina]|uniref:Uncharacterized protein LOC106179867 n=1 Tax=Lingula anatina TaxID=7574 RepID=A0A1S3KA47_LINAN|nr:uncharacterized protein LOC106179867 [Lingula anatina]|eukprot:XP_013419121.1 uncharacterized protein LOC106179867 [Lingula anatina]
MPAYEATTSSIAPEICTGPKRVAMISVHGNPLVPDSELGSDGKGGQNVYVREVGKQLSKLGFDVTWFTRSESPEEVGVVTLSPTLRCQYIVSGPQEHINRDFLFPYLDDFISQIDTSKFDCAFTNYWLSGYVGLRLGLPQLHVHHSLGSQKYEREPMPDIGPTRLKVEEAINKNADCMVHQTVSEVESCKATNPILIKAGINTDRFASLDLKESKKQLGFRHDTINVLFAGRFATQKGIPYAIEAMKKTKVPHRFRLVGNYKGSDYEYLVKENTQFEFLGQKTPDELSTYMAASDILIMPSLYEPFGIVAIEAMAAGCCMIVTSVGGLDEIVQDGVHGCKVPPGDAEAIRNAFEKLACNRDRVRKTGEDNRKFAIQKYSWSATATRIGQMLDRIVETKRKVPFRIARRNNRGIAMGVA